jgi:hypothetical protein
VAIQIVMDRTGDSRHSFNSHDAQEVAKAEGVLRADDCRIRSFDPNVEETVFFPRLVGA